MSASSRPRSRSRQATAVLATSALAFGSAFTLLGAGEGAASSHREAPVISADPTADNTDVYAFVSPDKAAKVTTTLIANWHPFQEPAGGPNFYPFATDARFNIKIDNNGDAKADITYRWTFSNIDTRGTAERGQADGTFLYNDGPVTSFRDATLRFKQVYKLERVAADGSTKTIVNDAKVAPSRVGKASMPAYSQLRKQAITDIYGGKGKTFAGQADDPFFLDLRVFDLLYGADLSETGTDSLAGYNVNTIALQVPTSELTSGRDPVIGVWSTTDRRSVQVLNADGTRTSSEEWQQVSRLGNPLVNEVVVPANLKDTFNAIDPVVDAGVQPVVDKVLYPEVPVLVDLLYGIDPPPTPRNDLFTIFLTGIKGLNQPTNLTRPSEMLRLNTSIPPSDKPNRLAALAEDYAGFPNGRRLIDDVLDIEVQALEGAVKIKPDGSFKGVKIVDALATGDKVDSNDRKFEKSFPYVALPHSGSAVAVGADGGSDMTSAASADEDSAAGVAASGGSGALPLLPTAGLFGIGALALVMGLAMRSQRRPAVRGAHARI